MKRKLRGKKYNSEVKEYFGICYGTNFAATFGNKPSGVAAAKRNSNKTRARR